MLMASIAVFADRTRLAGRDVKIDIWMVTVGQTERMDGQTDRSKHPILCDVEVTMGTPFSLNQGYY
jgi:hypothetical protein